MVVSVKRQDLNRPVEKKKKHQYVSLQRKGIFSPGAEIFLRKGYEAVFYIALVLFLFLCGMDMPYRFMKPVMMTGLRQLEIPDQTLMENMEIRTLKADASSSLPMQPENELIRLWDIPHFNYVVNRQDTISQISRQYHISISTILSVNKIENVKRISEGLIIRIPEVEGVLHLVNKGETLEKILDFYKVEKNILVQYNPYIHQKKGNLEVHPGQELFIPGVKMPEQDFREHMGELFIYPVQGTVLKGYGSITDEMTKIESFHDGIDIKGDVGDSVKASLNGKVIALGFDSSFGKYIIIEHSGGYRSLYAHLQDILVKKNDKILQGEIIGKLGTTGYSRIPHLHFSLFKGKKSIDPLAYLH